MASISPLATQAGFGAFCEALPPEAQASAVAARLCAIGTRVELARGERLGCDREADRLVFLASGAAKLVAPVAERATTAMPGGQVLSFHFAGDLVALLRCEVGACGGNLGLVALSASALIVFPAERFLDIAQQDPAVLRAVLTRALQALHRSRTRVMQMGHKSATARVADFLVTMADRLAGCTAGPCCFTLPMSRRDIGDALGLTIETVSRQFTELREAGLVTTEGRAKVCLADVAALTRLAGRPEPGARPGPHKPPIFDLDQQQG
ncbi:Crp/Fnr family transcriptional regulator [Erythrobacter cryptus]|uniref:Crp/Fnr family transcriptional regulator n=1 Tax=Erythrobacter cryptus TaxID=196588 RepID=UPI000425B8D6|nr:Crp/Fnr family transcriptional regulator [Erythrobacter cryptus]GIX19017.1 MAG: transcriptional regulator [Erythrobacter sp.]